jgi:heme-degrading monooxygenase HmoA
MPVRVVMRARIREEDREAFEKAYLEVARNVHGTPGHLMDELLRDLDDQSIYVLLAEWESAEQFFAWVNEPEHLRQSQAMYEYWVETFERSVYEVRASLDRV